MTTPNAVPHIVIHGYYGAGNFGDDIILLSIVSALRKKMPDADITVLCRNIAPIPSSHMFRSVSRFDLDSIAPVIKKADLFICGGGGIFQDYSGFDFSDHFGPRKKGLNYYAVPIEMAYLLSKPIMFYAVGAGPLFSPVYKRYLKTVLGFADIITVRDQPSAALITNLNNKSNPVVTADPAVSFDRFDHTPIKKAYSRCAGICLRSWFFKDGERSAFIRFFSNLASHLAERYGYKVILFSFSKGRSDYDLLKAVHQNTKVDVVLHNENAALEQTIHLIRQLDFLVGMRLHSLIVATAHQIPALGIAYDDKVKRYLNQLNMQDCIITLNDVYTQDPKKVIGAFIHEKERIKKQLTHNIGLLKEKEKLNAAMAEDLLRRCI